MSWRGIAESLNQFPPGGDPGRAIPQSMPGHEPIPIPRFGQIETDLAMEERHREFDRAFEPSAMKRLVEDPLIFAAVVREYDRRVGRAFLALPPDDLPAEARPLLHFGQRRGEKWEKFVREVARLVEVSICRFSPEVITYGALSILASDVSRGETRRVVAYPSSAAKCEQDSVVALLREVVPMTRPRWGRDYARRLREKRERGEMGGVPGPVATAVLGMVEEGVFTEERVRALKYRGARMKDKTENGGRP